MDDDQYVYRETTTMDDQGRIVPVMARLPKPHPAPAPLPPLTPSLCEKGCPEGECYHGEPLSSDFDDPYEYDYDE